MGRCHYCGSEDQKHDEKCPFPTHDGSLLLKWQRGWGHGFNGTICIDFDNPTYFLGYKMGRLSRIESDRRVAASKL